MHRSPKRVVVVGGGCAGLTAAYELTRPELGGAFEVTVIQPGWRLGGKGASSRGPCDRIEEHGIHLWMGCYENAFRMMRDVYGALEQQRVDCPVATWREAFEPITHIGLGRSSPAAGAEVWSAYFPPQPGLPGDPLDSPGEPGHDPFSLQGYLVRAATTLVMLVEHAFAAPPRLPHEPPLGEPEQRAWFGAAGLLDRARAVVAGGLAGLRSPAHVLDALRLLTGLLQGLDARARAEVLGLLDAAIGRVWQLLGPPSEASRDAMSIADVIEIVATSLRGCVADGVIGSRQGFEPLDAWDYRAWLRRHGASERCVDSAFVRGMYSLMFAYEDGDANRPRLSAGVFLRVCARMFFTYRGALFWRMTAGMGEIVFAPLYQLLLHRGVKFEFFHRLERVRLGDGDGSGTSRVTSLELSIQARTRDGSPYQPLVDVRGLPCWPSEPLWDQLASDTRAGNEVPDYEAIWCRREVGRRQLHAGQDFDFVAIAMGLAAIPYCCGELLQRHESWRRMVRCVKTVATQAVQVWAKPTLRELGWNRGPIMITGFHAPFDSWGDMSTLIDVESWPSERRPGTLAYFCNVLPDIGSSSDWCREDHATHQRAIVRDNATALLDGGMAPLWPGSIGADGRFRWSELVAPPGTPHGGIDSQYYRANCNPSDRYVLSLPGTGTARISPLDRDCDNLTVAGDWTACGVDVGCIEAAVMSGMLAAHALTGARPSTDDIIGYHHP